MIQSAEGSSDRAAMECFAQSRGLDRSLEIATDLTNLDHSMDHPEHPGPSPPVLAYTKYLRDLTTHAESPEQSGLRYVISALYCRPPLTLLKDHLLRCIPFSL